MNFIIFEETQKKITLKKIYLLLACVFVFSCSEDDIDYVAENEKEIVNYLATNNLAAQKSSSGLHYIITEPGTGSQPNADSNVSVNYKGYFTDGTIFDENRNGPISFNLREVIAGWTEGIPLFKEGGSGILLVPSHLGYGNQGRGSIPGGAVLIFEVELISVN